MKNGKQSDQVDFIRWIVSLPQSHHLSLPLFFPCVPGLSAPVPRGRKGKKLKNQLNVPEVKNADWLVHCNPEVVLQDESYKKHLKQHCNKSVHCHFY